MLNGISPVGSHISSGVDQMSQIYNAPIYESAKNEQTGELTRSGVASDTIEVDNCELPEEMGLSNMQALKNAFSLNQGFEQGLQAQFALNSSSGTFEGLEPGLQSGGVFKPPYDFN